MRFRLASVIALCFLASLATAVARAPQGRGGGAGTVIVPQVTPTLQPGQTAAQTTPLVATGLIVGRVLDAATGQPVSGASVALGGGPPRVAPQTQPTAPPGRAGGLPFQFPRILTDGEGRFAFRNLTRGNYTISVSKPGYSGGAYGRNRPGGPTKSLQLDDNERVADAVIKIFKFAAITGRITDEAGDPIVAAQVQVYGRVLVSGRRRFRVAASASTDDRGMYRIASLAPGDYVVAAPLSSITAPSGRSVAGPVGLEQNYSLSLVSVMGGSPGLGGSGRVVGTDGRFVLQTDATALSMDASGKWRGYATQYYPAARAMASAEVLTLPSGEERSGVDIQMRYVPVSDISGTLTTPDGVAGNLVLRLVPSDADVMSAEPEAATTVTDGNGSFLFAGIPSGQYVIQAVRVAREPVQFFNVDLPGSPAFVPGANGVAVQFGQSNQPNPQPPMLWASVPVAVGDNDVTGVRIAMQEGFTISGRYEFTGSRPRPDASRLQQIPVVIEPADGRDNLPSGMPSRSGPDGRFITATRMPGEYLLRIGGTPSGFVVQSITVNGVNATDAPFDLTGNVSNAIVTFTDQIASVTGTVRGVDPADDPPLVALFPADSRAWKDFGINPLRMKTGRAMAQSNFSFTFGSMVAGEYLAVAIPDEFSSEWQDPAYLELLSRSAERFTLGAGEKKSISIDVTTVRPPGAGRQFDSANQFDSGSRIDAPDGSSGEPRMQVVAQQAPARDVRGPDAMGSGSISGTISIDDGSIRPGRLARIRISGSGIAGERAALADEAGRYTFGSLPPGEYTVTVTKPSFLMMYYGGKRPTIGPGTPVRVAAGQAVANIDLTLPKGGVISGTVFDDTGQPAAGVRVQLLTFTRREGERVLTSASSPTGSISSGTTNDRGEYRFYGLRPLKYVVMATPQAASAGAGISELRQLSDSEMRAAIAEASRAPVSQAVLNAPRTIAPAVTTDQPAMPASPGRAIAYSAIFYPGSTREEDAGEIGVAAGQELQGINISIRLLAGSRIEGHVIGPDGQPALNAQVQLWKTTGNNTTSSAGMRQTNGFFQATSVAPGRYTLVASQEIGGRGGGAGSGSSMAQMDLDLNGDDQLNLTLALLPLPTITGRVIFDGGPPPDMKAVQIRLEPVQGVRFLGDSSRPATPDANGVFVIAGATLGKYRLNASITNNGARTSEAPAATGWTVASATVGGQDAFISAFDVKGPITEAEITLTNKPSEISGKLLDGNNKPALNMTVVLFPVDRTHWITNAARVNRISRPNAAGTFSFPLAIPGEYYLAVLTELDNNDWAEPDFKEQLVPAAVRVSIGKGEKKIQDMKVGG